LKFSLPLAELKGVSVSRYYDGMCVLHTSGTMKGDKGDMLFDTPHVIEFVTLLQRALSQCLSKEDFAQFSINVEEEIAHSRVGGKPGLVTFKTAEVEGKTPYVAPSAPALLCACHPPPPPRSP